MQQLLPTVVRAARQQPPRPHQQQGQNVLAVALRWGCMYTHTRAHMHTHTHRHTQAHIPTYTYTEHIHWQCHSGEDACTHIRKRICTYSHTHIQNIYTCKHIHIHTHTQHAHTRHRAEGQQRREGQQQQGQDLPQQQGPRHQQVYRLYSYIVCVCIAVQPYMNSLALK
jgi:hypothetical protein